MNYAMEIEVLMTEGISDLLVFGYLDSGHYLKFNPLYEKIFFVLRNGRKIALQINKEGEVELELLDEVKEWFDLEDDAKFAASSIYSQVFKSEQDISINSFKIEPSTLSVIELDFFDGGIKKRVIFDSRNYFGFTWSS